MSSTRPGPRHGWVEIRSTMGPLVDSDIGPLVTLLPEGPRPGSLFSFCLSSYRTQKMNETKRLE